MLSYAILEDPSQIAIYVPAEETLSLSTVLEQNVTMTLQELGIKNPTMSTIDELVDRIMDGSPGADLDQSLLKLDPNDSVMQQLTGGKNLMMMPEAMKAKEDFDFAKFADGELKDPTAAAGDGSSKSKEDDEEIRIV